MKNTGMITKRQKEIHDHEDNLEKSRSPRRQLEIDINRSQELVISTSCRKKFDTEKLMYERLYLSTATSSIIGAGLFMRSFN